MRVLLALALVLWATTDAHHSQEHNLKRPLFVESKTQRYEFTLNMTAGVPGLTSQVAKAVIKAHVNIRPQSETEYLLKIDNVKVSKPESSVGSWDEDLPLRGDSRLESELSKPVKFTLREGQVESYALSRSESLESKQIKRSILRHLQVHLKDKSDEEVLRNSILEYPYIYNITKDTRHGSVNSYYTVNVAPYPEFPYDVNVFNISKVESYERVGYPAYHEHHNFAKQGCPEVCKQQLDNETNNCGAECPLGYEPHQTPVKLYTSGHYNLRLMHDRMVLENAWVQETHVATMYDQDMTITLSAEYNLKDVTDKHIEDPREVEQYNDLDVDIEPELDSNQSDLSQENHYLAALYPSLRMSEAASEFERLLKELAETIIKADIETEESHNVGEKLIVLQKLLSILKKPQLESIWRNIVDVNNYRSAPEEQKVQRQIIMDLMPLSGNEETVEFLTELIKEKKVDIWEAKEMLIAIPDNLIRPNEKTIKNIYSLLEVSHVKKQHLLHSAAHITIARIINQACYAGPLTNSSESEPEDEDMYQSRYMKMKKSSHYDDDDDDSEDNSYSSLLKPFKLRGWSVQKSQSSSSSSWEPSYECPERFVNKFIKEIAEKLRSTQEMREKVVYIEALSHTGDRRVMRILAPYAFGTAKEMESFAPADVDFLKTVTFYALHNIVGYYPKEMLKYVIPVYFNLTEPARVRTAAFSLMIRSQPPLSLLQHVAQDSWIEPSHEVGSYVYSTVQTFGNSSEPCFQLTAKRIQLLISQFKAYDIGRQHARSIVREFFDSLRNFGVQYRTSYTPSNESFVPHSIYATLNYNIQNFKDVLARVALNIQGVPEEEILKIFDSEMLGMRWPKDIPSNQESQIFGTLNILPRLPKELRMTIYRKFFYSPDYWYLDSQTITDIIEGLVEHVKNVFTTRGEVKGHCVKVFIPSSYHTLSIGKIAAVPIEFYMKHPILLSASIKGQILGRGSRYSLEYDIKNSVYYTTYQAKHVINPADKKAYGVYHEQKMVYTLPFTVYMHYNTENKTAVMTFKFPELPQRFLRYHSEAGTYASDVKLSELPSSDNREPIRTRPTFFEKEKYFGCEHLLPVYLVSHSEDPTDYIEDIPRTPEEVTDLVFKYLRNPGWRKKSINGTMVRDPKCIVDTLTLAVSYNNTLKPLTGQLRAGNEWSSMSVHQNYPPEDNDDDEDDNEDDERRSNAWSQSQSKENFGLKPNEAKKLYEQVSYRMPHKLHELEIRWMTAPTPLEAQLRMEYNHTLDRVYHSWMTYFMVNTPKTRKPYELCLAHAMKYFGIPNEFEYDIRQYGSQRADFYSALSFRECKMFDSPEVVVEGSFYHVPTEEQFDKNEFSDRPEKEWFWPETHEDCVKDLREGKPLSIDCMRAVREEAIFNRYKIRAQWKQGSRSEIPAVLRNITYKVDRAIKYAFYSNLDIDRIDVQNPESTIEVTADYINKLVDIPIVNVYVKTPKENVHYHKINAEKVQPLSGLYRLKEHTMNYVTNNTYPPTCALMEKYVKTFDLKTYKLPQDECTYVVSTHCSDNKKFAVLARKASSSEKEVEVYVENHKIVLKPSQRDSYTIQFNGQTHTVKVDKPALLEKRARIHSYVIPVNSERRPQYILALHAENAGIYIQYDGKNVKLQVSPLYKGKLCGLCSEFDGETTREFRGVDQCLYTDPEDFAHSAVVDAQRCGVSTSPKYPVLCPDDEPRNPHHDRRPQRPSQSMRPQLQTINKQQGEFTCFSTQAVPMCQQGSEPQQTKRQTVDFHCLPKYDATTKRLITESQRRILHELSNKSVDFTESIPVPKSCSQ